MLFPFEHAMAFAVVEWRIFLSLRCVHTGTFLARNVVFVPLQSNIPKKKDGMTFCQRHEWQSSEDNWTGSPQWQ